MNPARTGDTAAVRRRAGADGTDPLRMLLLPGLGGTAAGWDRFATELRHQLATPVELWDAELPWTSAGDGRWSHGTDADRWVARAVHGVPAVAGGPADVLVAHSFAANLVLELLSRREVPDLRAVVLVSPFYRPAAADFDWATIASYLDGFHRVLAEGLRVSATGRLPAEVLGPMADRVRERIGPYGWMRFFDAYLRTPFLDTAAVRTPVLVVTGDRDHAATPADGRALARALPRARFRLLPDCGHFAMAEHPDRFAAAVRAFLDAVPTHPAVPDALLELT